MNEAQARGKRTEEIVLSRNNSNHGTRNSVQLKPSHSLLTLLSSQEKWSNSSPSPQFFLNLHLIQQKLCEIRFSPQQNHQQDLLEMITKLSECYTDCIDYFSSISETVMVYFQIKLKDINLYFKNIEDLPLDLLLEKEKEEDETVFDLGSISSHTQLEQLLNERSEECQGLIQRAKDVFNQNVRTILKNQNIDRHFRESMKKRQKMYFAVSQNIKNQMETVEIRIKHREFKGYKKQVSQSFSGQSSSVIGRDMTYQGEDSSEKEAADQLKGLNLDALGGEYDSPQKLKGLIEYQSRKIGQLSVEMNDY